MGMTVNAVELVET